MDKVQITDCSNAAPSSKTFGDEFCLVVLITDLIYFLYIIMLFLYYPIYVLEYSIGWRNCAIETTILF
jgi:hypothetical protein